jgi:hypothetical protein
MTYLELVQHDLEVLTRLKKDIEDNAHSEYYLAMAVINGKIDGLNAILDLGEKL